MAVICSDFLRMFISIFIQSLIVFELYEDHFIFQIGLYLTYRQNHLKVIKQVNRTPSQLNDSVSDLIIVIIIIIVQ